MLHRLPLNRSFPAGAPFRRRVSRLAPLLLALSGAFPLTCRAEPQVLLDAVSVTGSRVEHASFDLPAAIDVVDAARIGADQARVNASEALVAVPGVVVQNRQNYAQDLQISSRGFGARSAFGVRGIRLVADGIPASMPDGQGQAASFNLDRAERIEIMRGPLSVLYGNHSGGVIQLFTADGTGAPRAEARFSAGSAGSWKSDLASQGEANGVRYVVDASRFATEGYREHSAAVRDQGLVKLTLSPVSDGRLTLLASSFKQQADDPQGLQWGEFKANPRGLAWDATRSNTPALAYDTRKTISHDQGGLNYLHRLGEHSVQISAWVGQRSTVQYQSIPVGAQTGSARHSGGVIDFERDFSGLSARWSRAADWAGGRLTTSLGFDFEQSSDDRRGYENFVGSGAPANCVANVCGVKGRLRRNEEDRVKSFDQYAQAEWQGERWTLTGGMRHSRVAFAVDDRYIVAGNGNDSGRLVYEKTTPALAALWRASEAVNLYGSLSQGFEAPTFNEMFYSGGGGGFNYSLQPATSRQAEVGLKALLGGHSRLDLALFDIRSKNELVVLSSTGGRTAYQNAGRTARQGLELGLDSRWAGGLTSRVAYTYLDARYSEAFSNTSGSVAAGNHLPGIAAHQLFAEVVWRHPGKGWHLALEGVARDKVYVEDSNLQRAAPGYAIANLRAGIEQRYGELRLAGFMRLDNLFDRQYVGSVIVGDSNNRFYESAPGRSWLAGLSLSRAF